MTRWALNLFGEERLTRCGSGGVALPDISWPILGCLLAAPNYRTSRGRLAAQLWPNQSDDTARRRFATALWRIRTNLPRPLTLIATHGDHVVLAADHKLWVDAVAFERRARRALDRPALLENAVARRRLSHALNLYNGDFLADRDHEWIVIERARLRSLYLDAMHALTIAAAQAGAWFEVLASAVKLCAAEPLREDAQRLLIEAYARCGNRGLALQQYRRCEEVLRADLGIAPMPETRALAERVRGADADVPSLPVGVSGPNGDKTALIATRGKLVETLHIIDRALSA
jgi:DNA-binding SARP family transcriptional activator